MHKLMRLFAWISVGFAGVAAFAAEPVDKWWPSEWGADDERGALNRLTPAKVIEAALLFTKGEIYDMGRVFEEDMPLFSLTPKHRKYTLVRLQTNGTDVWFC